MPSDAMDSSRPDEWSDFHPPTSDPLSREELRAIVREWTTRLREQGLPPERVLAVVKRRVRDVIVPRTTQYADADGTETRQDRLLRDSSQWCIDALFDPSDR